MLYPVLEEGKETRSVEVSIPGMVPRGKIPPEACVVLPRKCSHHSFPHKDHLGAMISKEDQLLCLIFPAREWEACQIHIFVYIYLHMGME